MEAHTHLNRYAEDLREGMTVRRGDLIGYVGVAARQRPALSLIGIRKEPAGAEHDITRHRHNTADEPARCGRTHRGRDADRGCLPRHRLFLHPRPWRRGRGDCASRRRQPALLRATARSEAGDLDGARWAGVAWLVSARRRAYVRGAGPQGGAVSRARTSRPSIRACERVGRFTARICGRAKCPSFARRSKRT